MVTPAVAIAMASIPVGLLYVVIDIDPLQHLCEVERHPIKDHPCLRIGANMLLASSADSRSVAH